MNQFETANNLFAKISEENPHITPITPEDRHIFIDFFKNEKYSYGNSWPYIVQGMYGIGPHNLGYKYYDGKNLAAISINARIEDPRVYVLYWVRPMGPNMMNIISTLADSFLKTYNLPTAATKLFETQYNDLIKLGFTDVLHLPWHSTAPMEDDTHPEVINDVEKTVTNSDKKERTKKAVKQYERINELVEVKPVITKADLDAAWQVACAFFEQQLPSLTSNLSSKNDYYNLIYLQNDPQYHKFLIYKGNNPVGFFDYYAYNETYACAYASLMLRQVIPNLEDFTMIWLFNEIHKKGFKLLNQGGSETDGMDDYKKKFSVHSEQRMYWCIKK